MSQQSKKLFAEYVRMNIVIVAGEASGDLLGGKLVQSLLQLNNNVEISGIGGNTMRNAGMTTLFDISETSVVGIVEVIKHYPKLSRILKRLKSYITEIQPALIILIDYPEFNLKLAAHAKRNGVKVLFYVSPQVWAWRTGRIKKIRKNVDLMAVLFPFEQNFYKRHGVNTCLVQHPILKDIDQYYRQRNSNISTKSIKIGLLPGSRMSEIIRLFPIMLEAAQKLFATNSDYEFVVPIAQGIDCNEVKKLLINYSLPISFSEENFYSAISDCKAVVIASGTATLQAALLKKPMVIVYKISPLTYHLFGHMVKVKSIGLANIILEEKIFAELIQNDATADNIVLELSKLLNDDQIDSKMLQVSSTIHEKLQAGINSDQLAEHALKLTSSL